MLTNNRRSINYREIICTLILIIFKYSKKFEKLKESLFETRSPDLGIGYTNFIRTGRNRKIPITLHNKNVFIFLIAVLVSE